MPRTIHTHFSNVQDIHRHFSNVQDIHRHFGDVQDYSQTFLKCLGPMSKTIHRHRTFIDIFQMSRTFIDILKMSRTIQINVANVYDHSYTFCKCLGTVSVHLQMSKLFQDILQMSKLLQMSMELHPGNILVLYYQTFEGL